MIAALLEGDDLVGGGFRRTHNRYCMLIESTGWQWFGQANALV